MLFHEYTRYTGFALALYPVRMCPDIAYRYAYSLGRSEWARIWAGLSHEEEWRSYFLA